LLGRLAHYFLYNWKEKREIRHTVLFLEKMRLERGGYGGRFLQNDGRLIVDTILTRIPTRAVQNDAQNAGMDNAFEIMIAHVAMEVHLRHLRGTKSRGGVLLI
jgi:hypothetical protein